MTPARFSKSSFNRFAPVLAFVLKNMPNAVEVDPAPLSMETFAQRFRDIITAKMQYGYKHADVNEALFTQYHAVIVVRMRHDGKIIVGDKETSKGAVVSFKFSLTSGGKASSAVFTLKSHEHLALLCQLLSARTLVPTPQIKVHGLDPATVEYFENNYDVTFVEDGVGTHIIL